MRQSRVGRFDRQIKLEFHGSTVTSDAGLLADHELDYALRLTTTAASGLLDTRTGQHSQHSLLALLRQSIYSRLAGYEDVNDAERLGLDPALRAVVGGRAKDNQAASTSEMARFETESEGEASCAPDSGRDGGGTGGFFCGKIVATVPAGGYPYCLESQSRHERAPIWERSATRR